MDKTRQPGIQISQVFLERVAFSHRADHLEYPATTMVSPELQIEMQTGISSDRRRGIVRVQLSTKDEERPLYSVSIEMTALVEQIEGEENFDVEPYLQSNGWALLFPFLRESLANITSRGRFGPIYLNPVNVLALVAEGSAARDS